MLFDGFIVFVLLCGFIGSLIWYHRELLQHVNDLDHSYTDRKSDPIEVFRPF